MHMTGFKLGSTLIKIFRAAKFMIMYLLSAEKLLIKVV